MRLACDTLWPVLLATVPLELPTLRAMARPDYQVLPKDEEAGGYAAFPDVCRLQNGDLLCVFYAGYGHVSVPTEALPKGGRVSATRSTDGGKTWSPAFVVADTPYDDRDPSIAQLSDGTLLCNFFSVWPPETRPPGKAQEYAVYLTASTDNGITWSEPRPLDLPSPLAYACSSPVRELPDGSLILGLYHEVGGRAWGATVKSYDRGQTWTDLATIGENSGFYLDAETDVVRLADGTLFAALRSSRTDLYYATSTDAGKTWSEVQSFGFPGHCPYLLRTRDGVLLVAHRLPQTSLHYSLDEGKTWSENVLIDEVIGAYPSLVELEDGTLLVVYYEEGEGSNIRAKRFRASREGIEFLP